MDRQPYIGYDHGRFMNTSGSGTVTMYARTLHCTYVLHIAEATSPGPVNKQIGRYEALRTLLYITDAHPRGAVYTNK